MFTKTGFVTALLGASAVQAHMLMSSPTPYGKDSLNNSPLEADGSDFPCKQRPGVYDAPAEENILNIGEDNPLTFQGSAVHGGGSCQVSLTKDLEPTKDSKWMVIKSIEGGCPANVDGNLPENPDGSGATEFKYSVPEGIEPGKYTLAWTWFNRIGNREMYMNCAPVTVKGGSKKRSPGTSPVKRDASFPDMFVANVNGCTTTEGKDIRFPNPGETVEYAGNPSNLAEEGSEACTGTPSFGGAGNTPGGGSSGGSGEGSGNGSGGGQSSAPPAPTSAPPAQPTQPAGNDGGVFVPTTKPSEPVPTQPAGGNQGGASGAQSGACSSEGQWNCVDGSSFQRCANGQWTPAQPLASGTQCTPGQGADLSIAALKPRMLSEMRHRKRGHAARRHA